MNGMRLKAPSAQAVGAWRGSVLGHRLGPPGEALLLQAREREVLAGDVVHRVAVDELPFAVMVIDGLMRVYAASGQGRQVSVRYVAASEIVGLPTVLASQAASSGLNLAVQAVSDVRLLELSVDGLRRAVRNDPEVAAAIVEDLTNSLMNAYTLLAQHVFESVPRRVARALLDLAELVDGELLVRASQQSVADAIASVREVVSRVLTQMRDAGLIERIPNAYKILDPAELHRICMAP